MIDTTTEIDQLITQLVEWNRAYRAGTPLVPDHIFDSAEDRARLLAPDHDYFQTLEDDVIERADRQDLKISTLAFTYSNGEAAHPDEIAAYGQEVPLTIQMGSQQKALTLADPNLARFHEDTGVDVLNWSDKMDGMSAEATYVDGDLKRVATRGDGKIGVDITAIARCIPDLPQKVPVTGTLVVRGEICVLKSQFAALCEAMLADGRDAPKNTRNGTVGIVKTLKNRKYASFLSFRAFNMQAKV